MQIPLRCPCAFRLRRLAQDERRGRGFSEGVILLACRARFRGKRGNFGPLRNKTSLCVTGRRARFHACGRRGTFLTLLRRWQASVKMRYVFRGHFAWQAQYWVNLDDVLKGSKVSSCETVVIFDFGHDDDSVWQVQHFGCLGHIFRGKRHVFYTR